MSDRTGVVELARDLAARGMPIYATGGTRLHLVEHGVDARDVGDLTGFPALFEGRVKTLHPRVFGGILADRANATHVAEAREHDIPAISVVVVNLYPFEATVARDGATLEEAIEQIDIGGVALIRAAAKNYEYVTVLVDPEQYATLHESPGGETDLPTRRRLATRAFERTAEYDSSIARYLEAGLLASELPGSLALTIPIASPLRYGENPQSRAAFYLPRTDRLPEQLGGKALSYNNLLDLDATLRILVRAVPDSRPGVVRAAIVKHTVPCGVAERPFPRDAVGAALEADPVAAVGGIIALDGRVDLATAE
ncbi:MAG: bifunctional phosphoribosylaminoimidazolecarboxamide formyltransferase/IMP cyclohydrolase, partial [Candidatus Eremiobacteraeota bacterium]|nr:bifunctional phosphoribosylaminoimidazolecarboxamide formyltransferase/IMP cyclohydrolase [Candidatus Eremiobacteraeota bacterium]